MNDDDLIAVYLGDVGALLHGDNEHRERVLEEIEDHLRDAVSDYERKAFAKPEKARSRPGR